MARTPAPRTPDGGATAQAPARAKARRTGSRRIGILAAIAAAFVLSGLLRLGSLGDPFSAPRANASDGNEAVVSLAGPTAPLRSALDEVERLRAELADREARLAEREAALEAAQTLVEERLAELQAAETRLTELIAVSDTAAATDIDRLTRIYETMDAEEAAPLFAQMEPSFAAGFLSRMSPTASAALLSELEPEDAYAISVVLATRNAGAPSRDDAAETDD
jgi:flagellar motility protein MotE (MotC chaperone)